MGSTPLIPSPRTYGVSRHGREPLLRFMLDGLRGAGCRILHVSDASRAPFLITFETASGERMGVVAYAFTATRTPTRKRPHDERSFQVKYGSKGSFAENSHELWHDPLGLLTTILVGIDVEGGFFVAADPEMHNPTKFFIRIEFKDHHAAAIERRGWHSWERAHRGPFAEPVEVLVGGLQVSFLDFIRFERAARGLSPGDRQLLSERPALFTTASRAELALEPADIPPMHPLVSEFQLAPIRSFN